MTQWSCLKGNSLLIPSGPREGHKHLFALMLNPTIVDGYGSKPVVLLACVNSTVNGIPAEDACVLQAGEHPFIEHDSFVDYRFTRIEQSETVEKRVEEGVFLVKDACSPDLLKKIVGGALKSRRIDREFKMILEKVLFPTAGV